MAKKEKEEKKVREVPEKKKKILRELVEDINKNNTIMISFTTNVPSFQLQKIRKKLKEAKIKVVKKKMMIRALENAEKPNVKDLVKYLQESSAVIFSDVDPFDLAVLLAENRHTAKAKPGQIANSDIPIEAGLTDLLPGPVISELAVVGIKAGVEKGKITIKEAKIIVKKGEKISKEAANVLGKLDITPFSIGLEPVAVYDSKSQNIYTGICIDKETTVEKFKKCYSDSLQLAISIVYLTGETIKNILIKSFNEAKILQNKIKI